MRPQALLTTLGTLPPPAEMFASGRSNLRLIDSEEMVELILEHYEQLEPSYKALGESDI
jgi:restriction system protein